MDISTTPNPADSAEFAADDRVARSVNERIRDFERDHLPDGCTLRKRPGPPEFHTASLWCVTDEIIEIYGFRVIEAPHLRVLEMLDPDDRLLALVTIPLVDPQCPPAAPLQMTKADRKAVARCDEFLSHGSREFLVSREHVGDGGAVVYHLGWQPWQPWQPGIAPHGDDFEERRETLLSVRHGRLIMRRQVEIDRRERIRRRAIEAAGRVLAELTDSGDGDVRVSNLELAWASDPRPVPAPLTMSSSKESGHELSPASSDR